MAGSGSWPFDPVKLGRAEADAWAAYYRHDWAPLFSDQRRTLVASYSALRDAADRI